MYESPITLITDKIISEIRNDHEKTIYSAVQNVGISVDKEELVKALNYDRQQYEKGYQDGLNADKWISVDDELPEEDGMYLVAVKNLTGYLKLDYEVFECLFVANDWQFKEWKYNKVIAWQPLPDKPKEKK